MCEWVYVWSVFEGSGCGCGLCVRAVGVCELSLCVWAGGVSGCVCGRGVGGVEEGGCGL